MIRGVLWLGAVGLLAVLSWGRVEPEVSCSFYPQMVVTHLVQWDLNSAPLQY
jgi:hypothetical protein